MSDDGKRAVGCWRGSFLPWGDGLRRRLRGPDAPPTWQPTRIPPRLRQPVTIHSVWPERDLVSSGVAIRATGNLPSLALVGNARAIRARPSRYPKPCRDLMPRSAPRSTQTCRELLHRRFHSTTTRQLRLIEGNGSRV